VFLSNLEGHEVSDETDKDGSIYVTRISQNQ